MARNAAAEPTINAGGMRGFRLVRIFGFDVKLNPSWLLLGFLIAWTLAAGLFPRDYPELSPTVYWWMGIAGAIGILISIVFHELSHSLVARRFGLPIRGITLFIFGGVAEMEDEPASPKVEFTMAVAGPIASIVLGAILFAVVALARTLNWPDPVIGVALYLAVINIVLAIFNLVPAFPLDGGRMLRAAIWAKVNDLRRATRIASGIGAGFGLALILLGIFAFIQGNFIAGMWWVLIGAFLRSAAGASYQQVIVRDMLSDRPVRHFMQTDPITVPSSLGLQALLDDYVYRHQYKLFPVMDGDRLTGCVTTDDIKQVPREQWPQKTVRDVMSPCSPTNTVSPDASALKLISTMGHANAPSRYMVVENGRLLGMISMKDLREYIALRMELEKK